MTRPTPKKILVIRNDKLGDFMLSFPAFSMLKSSLPDAQVYALVPEYTRDMAESCQWIDHVLIDEHTNANLSSIIHLSQKLRHQQFDAIITLFSITRVGVAALLAGIPYRLAPATKLAQIFYNNRLIQRRSRSEKPEYAYNCDLIDKFCSDFNIVTAKQANPPYLSYESEFIARLRKSFCEQHNIHDQHKLVFVHAGSGGSARNLSLEQYAELASSLTSRSGHTIVISAGPGEYDNAHKLGKLLTNTSFVVYESRHGLKQFAEHIQIADLFIGGSTGPVHIAGAMDIPTVAFYPRRRSATSLRWQTLNSPDKRLSFMPPDEAAEEDMGTINIQDVALQTSRKFLSG